MASSTAASAQEIASSRLEPKTSKGQSIIDTNESDWKAEDFDNLSLVSESEEFLRLRDMEEPEMANEDIIEGTGAEFDAEINDLDNNVENCVSQENNGTEEAIVEKEIR